MENHAPRGQIKITDRVSRLCQVILQGVLYAYNVSHFLKTFTSLHGELGVPMKASQVKAMFRMMELLKAIEQTFHRRSMWVASTIQHIVQHYTYQSIYLVNECQKLFNTRGDADKRYTAKSLDVTAALELLKNALDGPGTETRQITAQLAVNVASASVAFSPQHFERLQSYTLRLEAISGIRKAVQDACNCTFFYWNRELVPLYMRDLYDTPTEAHRIHYLFACLRDCQMPLVEVQHEESAQTPITLFQKEIEDMLQAQIILPLCNDIETDLRLQIHSGSVQLDDRNPFNVKMKDLTHFLKVAPIRFLSRTIDIKSLVTHYLDTTFYDLTTVALHDWKVYGQMRNLAAQKYRLEMQDVFLPSQTLEQGLDVLEIMRNIHVFVAKYLYNLNNQIFVERSSNNKFLNTINIRHIANSIRTHGTGIMNTTVNFTYQFLRKKFFTFSQFLYDDHIKSRLIKDVRYFKEVKEAEDQQYPYERAEKFTKIIRKLGVNAKGESYLDQFRQLSKSHQSLFLL